MQWIRFYLASSVFLSSVLLFAQNKVKTENHRSVLLLVSYHFNQDTNFSSWAGPALTSLDAETFKKNTLIVNHFENELESDFRSAGVSLITPRQQGFEFVLPLKYKTTNLSQVQIKELMNYFEVKEVLVGSYQIQKNESGFRLVFDLNMQRGLKLESIAKIGKEISLPENFAVNELLNHKQYLESLSLAGKIAEELTIKGKSLYSYNLKLVGNYTRGRRESFREALKEHFGIQSLVKELVVTASDVVFAVESPLLENEFKKRLRVFSFQGRLIKDVQAEANDWVLLF